jgi:hypothetical protein
MVQPFTYSAALGIVRAAVYPKNHPFHSAINPVSVHLFVCLVGRMTVLSKSYAKEYIKKDESSARSDCCRGLRRLLP